MADARGRLSDEDIDKIKGWLRDKGADGSCPRCGKNTFVVNDQLMHVRSVEMQFPTVLVHCNHCTFTMFYSGNVIGIELPDSESEGGNDK